MPGTTQHHPGGNYNALKGMLSRYYNTAANVSTGIALQFSDYQSSSLLSFRVVNSGVTLAYGIFSTGGEFNIALHGTAVAQGLGGGATVQEAAVGGFLLGWMLAQAYPRGWVLAPAKNVNLADPSAANAFTAVFSSETTGVDIKVSATAFV